MNAVAEKIPADDSTELPSNVIDKVAAHAEPVVIACPFCGDTDGLDIGVIIGDDGSPSGTWLIVRIAAPQVLGRDPGSRRPWHGIGAPNLQH